MRPTPLAEKQKTADLGCVQACFAGLFEMERGALSFAVAVVVTMSFIGSCAPVGLVIGGLWD